jgi:hypothetical protein
MKRTKSFFGRCLGVTLLQSTLLRYGIAAVVMLLFGASGLVADVVYPVRLPGGITEWNLGTVSATGVGSGVFAAPATFGSTTTGIPPIRVNWLTPIYINPFASGLTFNPNNINSLPTLQKLFALPGTTLVGVEGNPAGTEDEITIPSAPTVDAFFVGAMDTCVTGVAEPGLLGCADGIPGTGGVPGHKKPFGPPTPLPRTPPCSTTLPGCMDASSTTGALTMGNAFDITFAAAANVFSGPHTEGHELGHLIGLTHCDTAGLAVGTCGPVVVPPKPPRFPGRWDNLMSPGASASTTLTIIQASYIESADSGNGGGAIGGGLIQGTAAAGYFINVEPIVFIPEPGSPVPIGALTAFILFLVRRKHQRAEGVPCDQ